MANYTVSLVDMPEIGIYDAHSGHYTGLAAKFFSDVSIKILCIKVSKFGIELL